MIPQDDTCGIIPQLQLPAVPEPMNQLAILDYKSLYKR